MPLTFDNPPINEVVFGQRFAHRFDFLLPHFGEFWARHKDKYPVVAHAPALVDEGADPESDSVSGILPRVWLQSTDKQWLIQLQRDRLYVNWRKSEVHGDSYSRFPKIKAEFDRILGDFEEYVLGISGIPIQPVRSELTYINIVDFGDVDIDGPADFGKVLKDFGWRGQEKRYLPQPHSCASKFEFLVEPDTDLTVVAATARRVANDEKVLRLEITARQKVSDSARTRDDWLASAHVWIVESFKDLTTGAMHEDHWRIQK